MLTSSPPQPLLPLEEAELCALKRAEASQKGAGENMAELGQCLPEDLDLPEDIDWVGLLDIHHSVWYFQSLNRYGNTDEISNGAEYATGVALSALPVWIAGLIIVCFSYALTLGKMCCFDLYKKGAERYDSTKTLPRGIFAGLFAVMTAGSFAAVAVGMNAASILQSSSSGIINIINLVLDMISDLALWVVNLVEQALNAVLDFPIENVPVEDRPAYDRVVAELERAEDSANRVNDEIQDYINGYSQLERVDSTAFIVFVILVVVIFLGVLSPIFALLATSRQKSIWRPLVFGILGFLNLGLSWIVAGVAMAIGTLVSDLCVAGYAVSVNTLEKAGVTLPADITIPPLPPLVEDIALTCPEEWFGTQPSLESIKDLLESSDFIETVSLIPGVTQEEVQAYVDCLANALQTTLLSCEWTAYQFVRILSLFCGTDHTSLMRLAYILFVALVASAAAFSLLQLLMVFGVGVWDFNDVYGRADYRKLQPPILASAKEAETADESPHAQIDLPYDDNAGEYIVDSSEQPKVPDTDTVHTEKDILPGENGS